MAIKVNGTTVIDNSRNISNVGTVTATSFSGNGSSLTGVQSGSVGGYALSTTVPALSVTAANTYALAGIGNGYNDRSPSLCLGITVYIDVTETPSTSFVNQRRITIDGNISGTVRFNNSVLHGNYGTAYLRLLKNGSQIASFTNTGSTNPPVLRAVDTSVQQGDVFQWQIRSSDGVAAYGSYQIYARLPTDNGMETASNIFKLKSVAHLTTGVLDSTAPYTQDV